MANRPGREVRVHATRTTFEAHMVASALAQHGVESRIKNEMLTSLAGAIPVSDAMAEIWVAEEDVEAALEVIAPILQPAAEAGRLSVAQLDDGTGALSVTEKLDGTSEPHAIICPSCGEESPGHFGECWSCQASLSPDC